jgi:hypothetical protein
MIALAASPAPDHQQFDAMLRDLHAMSQSVERIAAGQEQITRTVDQIATRIAAGQQQTTRTTDQTSTSVGQASYADPSSIAVEGRADRASSQPMVRLDIKPTEARSPQTLPERKLLSVAGGHDPFLPSFSFCCAAEPSWRMAILDAESGRSRRHRVLVRRRAIQGKRPSTPGKRPSKGDDAKRERGSRNNGEWAFRTACVVHAGSRMIGQRESVQTVYQIKDDSGRMLRLLWLLGDYRLKSVALASAHVRARRRSTLIEMMTLAVEGSAYT